MSKVSVIIPTYREPAYLDLCLNSAIKGQHYKNEIIVVVDGYYDENKEVLNKYKEHIEVLDLKENRGMVSAMNIGTYNASNDLVFHVQDDNVFPNNWDSKMLSHYPGYGYTYFNEIVLTPNQIEPKPSIFKQFIIKNFGENVEEFNYDEFIKFERYYTSKNERDNTGATFPFLISKQNYLRVGGFDETYPGPWVVDWEFFKKCEMVGMEMVRTYKAHFYHFASISTTTPEKKAIEQECLEYYYYKWKEFPYSHPETNSKIKK